MSDFGIGPLRLNKSAKSRTFSIQNEKKYSWSLSFLEITFIVFNFYSSASNCPFKSLRLVKSLLQPLLEQLKVSPESTEIVHLKLLRTCGFFRIFTYLNDLYSFSLHYFAACSLNDLYLYFYME
jgi:hypothetical protein